jgi:hypothetical protein
MDEIVIGIHLIIGYPTQVSASIGTLTDIVEMSNGGISCSHSRSPYSKPLHKLYSLEKLVLVNGQRIRTVTNILYHNIMGLK